MVVPRHRRSSAAFRGTHPDRRSGAAQPAVGGSGTAGAIFIISRGSNGFGMRYSGPKPVLALMGGGDHFICSAWPARQSRYCGDFHFVGDGGGAAVQRTRKMYGNTALFTWFRIVRAAVAMMASSRTAFTSSGRISGMGWPAPGSAGAAISAPSRLGTPPAESPRNVGTSTTSASVRASVACANCALSVHQFSCGLRRPRRPDRTQMFFAAPA